MFDMVQRLFYGSTEESVVSSLRAKDKVEESVIRRSYRIVLEKGQDGWIVVRCPDLQGVVTQGKTEAEAIRNAIEAIELMLEELGKDNKFNIIVRV